MKPFVDRMLNKENLRLAQARSRMYKMQARLHKFKTTTETITQEIAEITSQIAAMRANLESLPDGLIREEHEKRIPLLERRLEVLSKRAPEYNPATREEMEKTIAFYETQIPIIIASISKLEEMKKKRQEALAESLKKKKGE